MAAGSSYYGALFLGAVMAVWLAAVLIDLYRDRKDRDETASGAAQDHSEKPPVKKPPPKRYFGEP